MVLVVNEYGDFLGIVTFEDILEEVVGDIYDEYDSINSGEIKKIKDNEYEVRKLLGATKYQLFKDNKLALFDIFDYKKRGFKTIKEIRKDLGIVANP